MLAASEHDFIDLHTQHFTRVYRYIAYRINDLPRAEELAADVFRIAWQKKPAEPPGIGWLLATARRVLSNEYKGRRRRLELIDRLKDQARSQAPGSNDEEQAAVADVLMPPCSLHCPFSPWYSSWFSWCRLLPGMRAARLRN